MSESLRAPALGEADQISEQTYLMGVLLADVRGPEAARRARKQRIHPEDCEAYLAPTDRRSILKLGVPPFQTERATTFPGAVMSAQEAFWNWLRPWIAIGIGFLASTIVAVLISAFGTKRREID